MSRSKAIEEHFRDVNENLRPILTSLNGDNSWLMSFPRPAAEREAAGRAYFHIVSDAWLEGPTGLFSWWVLQFSLVAAPTATHGDDVEAIAKEIEEAAQKAGILSDYTAAQGSSFIDAIFENFWYSDHLHEPTLRFFNANIPVFACAEAAATIRGWDYFSTVITTQNLDPSSSDWRALHPGSPLPEWLSVFRLLGHHELNFATAIVWSHHADNHEALLYSPHGIKTEQPTLQTFLHRSSPSVSILGILHALHDSFAFGLRKTLGVAGGLALEREAKPKYWIKTHDQLFVFTGMLSYAIFEVARTLESGLNEERELIGDSASEQEQGKPNFIEVDNGGSFVMA